MSLQLSIIVLTLDKACRSAATLEALAPLTAHPNTQLAPR